VPTEDHPLDYENMTEEDGRIEPMAAALAGGHALVRLRGEKLRGGYALQRIGKGDEVRWLLVKLKDKDADARRKPTSTEPESVLSGRTIDEIEHEGDR
jgi:hypothetical protein